jgi:hypothetical protein
MLNKHENLEKIIYLFNTLNDETVDNFKMFLGHTIEPTASLNLVVINRDDYPKEILKKFEIVKIIDL